MELLLDELQANTGPTPPAYSPLALERSYTCQCGRPIFFRNHYCLNCHSPLGYEPKPGRVFSLAPGPRPETWRLTGANRPEYKYLLYRRCANAMPPASCNWLVPAGPGIDQPFCLSCRLNRTIPDLSSTENRLLWGRIEAAKRRVVSTLAAFGLPIASRVSEDTERGLAFDFLQSPASGPRVLTGHDDGIITLNIEEADDVKREQIRNSMHEPYRTLVGHFRHEVGHYYWDRLVANTIWHERFRPLFGDERSDYDAALKKNYEQGPDRDWPVRFVSAYASIHPWEDWAETWAHYMHMVDALGTAMSFGIRPESIAMPFDSFGPDALCDYQGNGCKQLLSLLNAWLKMTAVMNELCRSMGQPDFYPFALPRAAVAKLHFVHLVVTQAA